MAKRRGTVKGKTQANNFGKRRDKPTDLVSEFLRGFDSNDAVRRYVLNLGKTVTMTERRRKEFEEKVKNTAKPNPKRNEGTRRMTLGIMVRGLVNKHFQQTKKKVSN